VEVTASSDVESLGCGVWRDDEVGAGGESVPWMVISMLNMASSVS
jgi:hypothetical protein